MPFGEGFSVLLFSIWMGINRVVMDGFERGFKKVVALNLSFLASIIVPQLVKGSMRNLISKI